MQTCSCVCHAAVARQSVCVHAMHAMPDMPAMPAMQHLAGSSSQVTLLPFQFSSSLLSLLQCSRGSASLVFIPDDSGKVDAPEAWLDGRPWTTNGVLTFHPAVSLQCQPHLKSPYLNSPVSKHAYYCEQIALSPLKHTVKTVDECEQVVTQDACGFL